MPEPGARVAVPLAKEYYWDPAILNRERAEIFHATWQLVGHDCDLAAPGSYLVATILDQEIAVVRQTDGGLRAFYNVCAHRAHPLLSGQGVTRLITCPYHAWVYELDGRLRAARNSENVPGFEAGCHGLTPVRLESFGGFLFVNLDDAAPSLAESIGAVPPELADFAGGDTAAWTRRHHSTQVLKCNWKLAVENYAECYHCAVRHPLLRDGVFDMASYRIETRKKVHRHSCRGKITETAAYGAALDDAAHRADFSSWYLWPNAALEVYPGGYMDSYHWMPLDAETTLQTIDWYGSPETADAALEEIGDLHLANTVAEDISLVEAVQKGLRSRGYRKGALMIDEDLTENSEHAVWHFQEMVRQALGA